MELKLIEKRTKHEFVCQNEGCGAKITVYTGKDRIIEINGAYIRKEGLECQQCHSLHVLENKK